MTPRARGTHLGMDNAEKKKAPFAAWILVSVALALLVMLVIGIAVL